MRHATKADWFPIIAAIAHMIETSPARQMKFIDPDAVELYLKSAMDKGRLVFKGGYMILFDLGYDWYSTTPVLVEQLILKVYPDNKEATVDDAIAALDDLRDLHGCAAIMVGDTQVGYMTPRYQAAGYHVLGTQLMK